MEQIPSNQIQQRQEVLPSPCRIKAIGTSFVDNKSWMGKNATVKKYIIWLAENSFISKFQSLEALKNLYLWIESRLQGT